MKEEMINLMDNNEIYICLNREKEYYIKFHFISYI